MSKMLTWLENRPLINVMLALAFFMAVVAFHDEVTLLAIKLRRSMSVSGYNLFFTLATVSGFGIWSGMVWFQIRKSRDFKTVWGFLLPTLLLIAIFFVYMMTYAVEAVHFFQYAILAILLFPLLKSYGAAVFWATLLGVLDEIYQYVILTPDFNYFDFNDILLNLLGAGLASVTIYIMSGIQYQKKSKKKSYRVVCFTVIIVIAVFSILYLLNYIRWYPDSGAEAPRWFAINRTPAISGFWTEAYKGKFLHILRPWEGMLLLLIFFGYYFLLDRLPGRLSPSKKIT